MMLHVYKVAKKVSQYQESSLNRTKKTASAATFLINFEYKIIKKCYEFVVNILCVT